MSDLAAQRNNDPFADCEVISIYTRKQAIDDGVLVDVSLQARELGFKYPVAVNNTVWESCVSWDNDHEKSIQDESGRLYDVLWMASLSARRTKGSQVIFDVYRVAKGQSSPTPVSLKSICGPGDHGEPVITIMRPWED